MSYNELLKKYNQLKEKQDNLRLMPQSEKNTLKIDCLDFEIQDIKNAIHQLTFNYTDLVSEENLED